MAARSIDDVMLRYLWHLHLWKHNPRIGAQRIFSVRSGFNLQHTQHRAISWTFQQPHISNPDAEPFQQQVCWAGGTSWTFPNSLIFPIQMQDHYSNSKGITNLSHRDHLHKISNGNNDKSALPNASIETDITKRSSSLILDSKADNALSNPMYDRI